MAESQDDLKQAYDAYQAYKAYKQSKQPQDKAPEDASFPMRSAAQQDITDMNSMDPGMKRGVMKAAVGLPIAALGGELAAPLGIAGRALVNGGGAGLQKYLSNLIDHKQDSTDGVLTNAAVGGGVSAAADGVSAGAGKLADYLMQKAAGMRKYIPGIGNKLVDQGLVGTRNMLSGQVEDKLPLAEQAVQDAVSGTQGTADAQPISDAISRLGNKFKLPSSGDAAPGMQSYADKVKDAASEFESMGEGGELTPKDLLAIKRQGDWLGYTNSGSPATSLEAEIGRAQADQARATLSQMSGGKSADALGDEQALILAKKALTKPETLHQGMGSSVFFGKYPGQSLFGSAAAQGLQKGVQGPAGAVADPEVLQLLFGAKNSSSGQ